MVRTTFQKIKQNLFEKKPTKQNSMMKKQQKMLEQQQLQQLQQQLSQSPLVNQFASLIEQQQILMAFAQQQQMNTMMPLFPQNAFASQLLSKQMSMQQGQQQPQMKRKNSSQSQLDYLVKPHKKVDRRHADPAVSLATLLENLLNELREAQDAQPFLAPVNSKKVPDYYNVVKNPLDLQTIRKRVNEKFYKERNLFLADMQVLIDNSALYNGANHTITNAAQRLYAMCAEHFEQHSDKFLRLEKAINPLLDDNSLIAFNYLLNKVYDESIMPIENSFSFLKPVSKQKYKDYYEIVQNPIDLETIKAKINAKSYKSRDEFVGDFELLYNNCLAYNGLNSSYTNTAQRLLSACRSACQEDYGKQMEPLEEEINNKISINDDEQELGRHASSISVDALTDSESNLASNYQDNESMDENPPIPVISMAKKLKAINKNASNNSSNRPNTSASFSMQQSLKKKKSSLFFSNKNSPRSG
jgi:transcription initiation factor TFIID subunit 1